MSCPRMSVPRGKSTFSKGAIRDRRMLKLKGSWGSQEGREDGADEPYGDDYDRYSEETEAAEEGRGME